MNCIFNKNINKINFSKIFLALMMIFLFSISSAQVGDTSKPGSKFRIARLKYSGGGDWYNDPTAEVNMMDYLKKNTTINVDISKFYSVDITSDDIFDYPFIIMTGHGNIELSDAEVLRLRKYCQSGGFLYADDDYGMDESFRREIKKVFPSEDMRELPFDNPIYKSHFLRSGKSEFCACISNRSRSMPRPKPQAGVGLPPISSIRPS